MLNNQYTLGKGVYVSLYAAYVKERAGMTVFENEKGFVTFFKVPGTSTCYIEEIFVLPEFRKSGVTAEYESNAAQWAVLEGCTELMGSVDISANSPERNVMEMLKAGYKIKNLNGNMIYFVKSLIQEIL